MATRATRACLIAACALAAAGCGPPVEPAADRYLFATGLYRVAIAAADGECVSQLEPTSQPIVPINVRAEGGQAIVFFPFWRHQNDGSWLISLGYKDLAFAAPNDPPWISTLSAAGCGQITVEQSYQLTGNEATAFTFGETTTVTTEQPCDASDVVDVCQGKVEYGYQLDEKCGDGCEAYLIGNATSDRHGRCGC
ncbi:MAG: hypothetical protein JXR83_15275 [Deltaproteobacteria bacterium]|nr:hypothetical protein [Deltaproteobacteria bacterium]